VVRWGVFMLAGGERSEDVECRVLGEGKRVGQKTA
jgi:hypothetical protein